MLFMSMDEIYIQGNLRTSPFFLIRYQLGLLQFAFLKTFFNFQIQLSHKKRKTVS